MEFMLMKPETVNIVSNHPQHTDNRTQNLILESNHAYEVRGPIVAGFPPFRDHQHVRHFWDWNYLIRELGFMDRVSLGIPAFFSCLLPEEEFQAVKEYITEFQCRSPLRNFRPLRRTHRSLFKPFFFC
jgi:hypothetical protein